MTKPLVRKPSTLFFQSGLAGIQPVKKFSTNDNGQKILSVTGMPVFRSGTFADSMGDVTTWTPLMMSQAKANYDSLVETNTVPHVPVRKGHGSFFGDPMDTLVGWHTGLSTAQHANPVDGALQTYLLADFYLFDEEAQQRYDNGDWPNRSSEIGTYYTNDNAEINPAYMGFAFVDLPAVEGLNYGRQEVERKFTVLIDKPLSTKEHSVSAPAAVTPPEGQAVVPPVVVPPVPAPPAVAPVAPVAPTAQFAAPTAQIHTFKVNGADVTDFGMVQSHITGLETFRTETLQSARKNFVNGLATDNKISAAQIESLSAFALGLSDDQYMAWKGTYDTAIAIPALQNHTAGANNTGSSNGRGVEADSELMTVRGIVQQHTLAGMPQAQIEKLASFKRMRELEAAGAK